MEHTKKPWLRPDGTLKSKAEIKKSSENWSFQIWEEYLKTLDVDREEILLDDPVCIEDHSQQDHEDQKDNIASTREFPVLKKYLFELMKELRPKQQRVLNCLFLEGLNLREIGEGMGVSAYAVARRRDCALKNLGSIMMERLFPEKSETPKEKQEAC